jgi:hypothetical protein
MSTFAKAIRRWKMKKIAYAGLILTMAIFLISPLSSEARGGRGGHGGYGGWWVPWAVLGGAAILTAPYYYAPYYSPSTVIIREQPPEYFQPIAPVYQPAPSVTPLSTDRIFVYPRQGQNEELQAKDSYECHNWAVSQTGYNPTQPSGGMPEAQMNQKRSDYLRAQSACFDGRGYTMK